MYEMIFTLTAILCVAQFNGIDAKVTALHQKRDFPGQELVFSYESYRDGKLTYAACEKTGKDNERICRVVREKMPYSDEIYSCYVKLKLNDRKKSGGINSDKIGVIPIGMKKAVLYLAERGKNANVEFNTINFDDCKVAETEISVENPMNNAKYAVFVTPYDDSYDVLYKNSSMCGDKGYCKINIDASGKIVEGPKVATESPLYVSYYPYVVPIDSHARSMGAFYMDHVKDAPKKYDFVVRKPDGSKKSLGIHEVRMPVTKSTAYDFIGLCYKENESLPKVTCQQYSDNGEKKFEVDPVSGYNQTEVVLTHNLPNGGLLLLAGSCEKPNCEIDEVQLLVIKIDSTGRNTGTLSLGNFPMEADSKNVKVEPLFYVNQDNNYCLSVAYFRSTETGDHDGGFIESNARCFTQI